MVIAKVFLLLPGIFLLNAAATLANAPSSPALTKEAKEAFNWLDQMEFPNVRGKNLALVATGHWSKSGEEPPHNTWIYGFLLFQDSESFTVLDTDLRERTFRRTPPSTPEHERVDFEIVDLPKNALRYSRFFQNPQDDKDLWSRLAGGYLSKRAALFVMAWGCWKNGLTQLAQSLYEQAKILDKPEDKSKEIPPMRDLLEQDLGHGLIWLTTLAAGDPSISRPELLKRFERITKFCQKSEHAKQARTLTAILSRMIREDKDHRPMLSSEKLSIEQQVAELIFKLRDQNGYQISQPGWCDIFRDPRGEESPANRLVKMGLPAVSQLIKALDDNRLTRSIEYGRNFYFSHYILRVGDAALAILESIAQRSFCNKSGAECSLRKPSGMRGTRAQALSWWRAIKNKGEQDLLIESVAGADGTVGQARQLATKYPAVALSAIWRGVQNSTEEWYRARLVNVLGDLSGNEAEPFLLQEMNNSPFLNARVAAAHALFRRGRLEVVPAMIQEWKNRLKSDDYFEQSELLGFLAWCNNPEAIKVLSKNLADRPTELRSNVIEVFNQNAFINSLSIFASNSEKRTIPGNGVAALSEPVRAEIEKLLVSELEDTDEMDSLSGLYPYEQRLCDKAGAILAAQWPARYIFDAQASLKQRNQQRIESINSWRKSQGMREFEFPSQRSIAEQPNEIVEVSFSKSIPNSDLELAAKAISGKVLTPEDFISLAVRFIQSKPEGISKIRIQAVRYEDRTGIRINIRFDKAQAPDKKALNRNWHHTTSVTVDRKALHGATGIGDYAYLATAKAHREFRQAIDEALNSSPEIPFTITAFFQPGDDPEETKALLDKIFNKPPK